MNFIIENWAVLLPFALALLSLILAMVAKYMPSDNPAKPWIGIIGDLLSKLLKDYSKETDENGGKITHDEINFMKRVKKDRKLRNLFKIRDAD